MAASSEIFGDVSQRFNKANGYTHTGKFDSDNVLTTALFTILNPDFAYYRQDDLPFEDVTQDGVIFYDFNTDIESILVYNHKANVEYRSDDVQYSTFGLAWRDFGPYLLIPWEETEDAQALVKFMVDQFDDEIIKPMDMVMFGFDGDDEAVTWHPIIEYINDFNLVANEGNVFERTDRRQYAEALVFARSYLLRQLERYRMAVNAMLKIYNDYKSQTDLTGIVYIDNTIEIDTDWALDFICEHLSDINYVIRPSTLRGYNIFPVKKTLDQLKEEFPNDYADFSKLGRALYKMPLPSSWGGLTPEELNDLYKGLFFCNTKCTQATVDSETIAINICKRLINAYAKEKDIISFIEDS